MFETITDRKANRIISIIVIVGTIVFALSQWFFILYLTAFILYIASFKFSEEHSLKKKIIMNTLGLILLVSIIYTIQFLFK